MDNPLWQRDFQVSQFIAEAKQHLKVAMQPIADASTGEAIAYEALVRGVDKLGFAHPGELFNHAYTQGALMELDTLLISGALKIHAELRKSHWSLLFVNVDGRLLERWAELGDFLCQELKLHSLRPLDLCIELSETHQPLSPTDFAAAVEGLRKFGFLIAVDDFGTGNSGMQMLYQSSPDFIKIDRFFIESMPDDPKKRLLVTSISDLAHTLGARVIAEGIETVEELRACREVNSDLVQGYLVARPSLDLSDFSPVYETVSSTYARPHDPTGAGAIGALIEDVAVLSENDSIQDLIDLLLLRTEQSVFPVIDRHGMPRGAVRETDVKPLLYSQFGRDLADNPTTSLSLMDYVRPIATIESNTPFAPRLEFIAEKAGDGVIITKSLRYEGYLSSAALLKLSNDLRIKEASSQNPLSGLPGNQAVQAFLNSCVNDTEIRRILSYIDIDNFKPFNDKFGFEIGDRALLHMASILKTFEREYGLFVAHIGGDDFFVGAEGKKCDSAETLLDTLNAEFSHSAQQFYGQSDIDAGYIMGSTRDGQQRRFPLLGCTVALLELRQGHRPDGTEVLTQALGALKSEARTKGDAFLHEIIGKNRDIMPDNQRSA
jgi:diguanylate cyclase (GGDEF)-like protein